MPLITSKSHLAFFAFLMLLFGIIDFFPWHGPPAFRYTGSDPSHHVWNLGWPIPWIIYDEIHEPCWFAWLGTRLYGLFVAEGAIVALCLLLLWVVRKK